LHGLGPEELDALAIDEGDELDQRISKLRNLTANEIEANADQRYGGFMVDPAEAARAIREMGSWDPFECDVALMALANVLGREILIDYPDRTELILPTVGHRTQLGIHCDGRDLYW
jgi:hypothetical protein